MRVPKEMRAYVDKISRLSPSTWRSVERTVVKRTYRARDHICPFGRTAHDVGLLVEGWVRAYVSTDKGHEFTKHLFSAPSIVGDYASLLTGEPVRVAQQTLTNCTVFSIRWDAIQLLSDHDRDIERLLRRFAEAAYLEKEEREIELATMDAQLRYERALVRYPGIEQALPQYEIAAYLAITPTQLSRVRSRRAHQVKSGGSELTV